MSAILRTSFTNFRMLVIVWFFACLACQGNDGRTLEIRIVSTPTVGPTPASDSKLIKGSAFLYLKGGGSANPLSGMKISLIDGTLFEARFNKTREEIITRKLCSDVYALDMDSEDRFNEQVPLKKLLAEKHEELNQFRSVKWAKFTYTDIKGISHPDSSWFDGKTLAFMMSNIAELDLQIAALDESLRHNAEKIKSIYSEMVQQNPALKSPVDSQRYYEGLKHGIVAVVRSRKPSEFFGAQEYMSVQDLLADLDKSTLDTSYADESGKFSFQVDGSKRYLCFAYHGDLSPKVIAGYMWIMEVTPQNGEFRRVILSDSNSFNTQNWDSVLRPEVVKASFNEWLSTFDHSVITR